MIRITKEQIIAFEEVNLRRFIHKAILHLRNFLPETVTQLNNEDLINSLRARLTQALSYGITDRFDILRYLECRGLRHV
jgi:hypothetical protein